MDPDPPPPAPRRKFKFAPKPPVRRTPKPATAKMEIAGDGEDEAAKQRLTRLIRENLSRRDAMAENKSSDQVTFSLDSPSTILRTYGKQSDKSDSANPKEPLSGTSDAAMSEAEALDDMQRPVRSISTSVKGFGDDSVGLPDTDLAVEMKGDYKEPWDYNTNYPITLPWRKPNSGNPGIAETYIIVHTEILDKTEFENAVEYDENSVSSASELGLLDINDAARMLLFKFPSNLPQGISHASKSSKGKAGGSSVNQEPGNLPKIGCSLEELPEGHMGKMQVYKSGAVKLKLGDVLYDVSPGTDCSCAQSLMAINATKRECCELEKVKKLAMVTPNIDYLLDWESEEAGHGNS